MKSTPSAGLSKYLSTHASFRDPRSSTSPLPALYSDLSRQRKSNPAGYRASIEWWKDILLDITFQGLQFEPSTTAESSTSKKEGVDRLVFRLDESCKARWTIDGVGRPLGLGTVMADLEKDRTVVSLNTYLKSSSPIAGPSTSAGLRRYLPTPRGLASALLVAPVRWGASSIYNMALGGSNNDDDGDYSEDERLFRAKRGDWVWFELVSRLSNSFTTEFYQTEANLGPLSLLMTLSEFQAKLGATCRQEFGFLPSDRDTQLVLTYLLRDRPQGPVVKVQDGLVKLAPSEYSPVEEITEEDRGIISVHSTLLSLDLQITSLETQISTRNEAIKTSLRSNQPSQAKLHLRSRKALEQVLEKRMAVRDTLGTVMAKIEQAKGDVEVMRAFKASEGVLRGVLGSDELKVDNVERVMEGLTELMHTQAEVDAVIRDTPAVQMDEQDLEEELRSLEQEKRQEENEQKHQTIKTNETKTQDDLIARFDRLRVAQAPLTSPHASPQPHSNTLDPPKAALAE